MGASANGLEPHGRDGLPPPPDQNGERWGDWIISTNASENITLTFETIKLHGNIRITSGSVLRLTSSSQVVQFHSSSEHYTFEVHPKAVLIVEQKSKLDVDKFVAEQGSIVTFEGSQFIASGVVDIASYSLTLNDSTFVEKAPDGPEGTAGLDAIMTLDGDNILLNRSSLVVTGGSGGHATTTQPSGPAGSSALKVRTDNLTITGTTINVSGGRGGDGLDASMGAFTSGGPGGVASVSIDTGFDRPIVLDSSTVIIRGGDGGRAGNGAHSQDKTGGTGGSGGPSGTAMLNLTSSQLSVKDSSIMARAGDGGKGGSGGSSLNSDGGDGGNGGPGSTATINALVPGHVSIISSIVRSNGGNGGFGGFFGDGVSSPGLSGNGGQGGSSSINLMFRSYEGITSNIHSTGGSGGWGGLGPQITGSGGDGGDALLILNVSDGIVNHGPITGQTLSEFGSTGGDGGNAGEVPDPSHIGNDLRGKGGSGGNSRTILQDATSITFERTHILAAKGKGGLGSRPGLSGSQTLELSAPIVNCTNGTLDWKLTGILSAEQVVLKNTTGPSSLMVIIPKEQCKATAKVFWYVSARVDDTDPSHTWEVAVYLNGIEDGNLVTTRTIKGGTGLAQFLLLGASIDCHGTTNSNYTVIGRLIGTDTYTLPAKFILSSNKAVALRPPINMANLPRIAIFEPYDKQTLDTWRLAPCRSPTPEEIQSGISPPGCLVIEGQAWVDVNFEGVIDDIKLWLINEDQGTFFFRASDGSIKMTPSVSRIVEWSFNWEVDKYDKTNHRFNWSEGPWTIMVSAHSAIEGVPFEEAGLWSKTKSLNISLQHSTSQGAKPLRPYAGTSESHIIRLGHNGVKVTFKGANVNASTGVKVLRMEWDYNGDGSADWSYVPIECGNGTLCNAPVTDHVYTEEGSYTAQFCAYNDKAEKVCDWKTVQISKEEEPEIFGIPQAFVIGMTVSIVAVCSLIISALVIASMSEATKFAIMSFILVPLYTRLKKEEMLDNYTRGEIRGYIVANPGTHYSRIKRDLVLNNGTLIYHLHALEKEGFIYSHRDDYYRRFYPRGRKPRPGPNLTTVQETIIETLLDDPNLTADELSLRLSKSRKVINYHLVWLRRMGQVESHDDGRSKRYSVIFEDETEMVQDGIKAKEKATSTGTAAIPDDEEE